jgi:hypothetical protein
MIMLIIILGCYMAIKSSTFGRVELNGSDADKFLQIMNERKSNPKASAALKRGREILKRVTEGQSIEFKHNG